MVHKEIRIDEHGQRWDYDEWSQMTWGGKGPRPQWRSMELAPRRFTIGRPPYENGHIFTNARTTLAGDWELWAVHEPTEWCGHTHEWRCPLMGF